MPSGFKLLMILSTPFPLRPSTAIHFARHSRLPLEALFPTVASRGRLLSVVPSSKFGFFIRAAEQVHTQALAKEGYSETATSYPGFKDSYSWPEWSKLADHLLDKGYSQSQVTLGDQDDSLLTDKGLPEEFLRAAGACLDFARERPDILRLLTKKYIKAVVENGSPFLFKNGDESVSRMKFFLSGDASTALEHEKAQTIDIMRYLLSYMYKSYSSSNGNQLKDYESVESSVRKLLLELFNFSGTVWRSKLTEPTKTELPLGNEQLSRPPGKSFEMKRGDWICQKCTFMNFARNMNCLECGEARPKKQLTGAEWECPQCDFFNYGRNTSCLRCDHKRPGDVLLSPTTAAGVGHTRSSNFEQNFAVSKQDSQGGSSIRSGSDDTSDSISRSLDRILGRSSTPSGNMSNSGDKNTSALGNFSSSQLQNMATQKRNPYSVPFVPLPQDMFRKTQESNNGAQQSSDKAVASSPNTSDFIDSLLKTSENSLKSGRSEESSNASLRWSKTAAELENAKDPANVVPDDDFPDIMPIRKGENRFVVSKKKDRSLTSPAYKRRLAMEQANNYNSVPFVPFPPGYFAKKDNQQVTDPTESAAPSDKVEVLPNKQGEQELGISDQGFAGTSSLQSRGKSYGDGFKSEYSGMNLNQNNSNLSYGISTGSSFQTTDRSWDNNRETSNRTQKNSAFEDNASYASPYHTTQADNNLGKYSGYTANSTQQSTNSWNNSTYSSQTPNTLENYDSFSAEYTANSAKPYNNLLNNKSTSYGESIENSSQPPINTWNNSTSFSGSIPNPTQPSSSSWSSGSAQVNNVSFGLPQQSQNPQSSTGKIPSGGYSGKSLEGSCVKEMDPLDMSEEAKAERWFRRAAQIKDISELSQIPDEDFPEIMPMRKGVNRFVVSKRKTPLERRLTSPQYRRNLPIMSSEPEKDADN